MKSRLLQIRVHFYECMSYITGYKVDVQDELPPEVLHYIHVGKNEYLTPVQMMCLLQWVRDRRKYDNPKMFHRFRDFVHKDEFMFPGLVINNEMALKYNIPVEMINMEKIKDTKLLQQEIDRIFEMQEDYYDNYKVGQDGLKTQYYAMERGRKPKVPLPGYMSSAADIAMRNRLLVEAQNKSLQARVASIEKESRENEEKVKADLLAKEEKDKLIERLRNLDPPEPPFKYDRNANRLHIPEPGKIPAPNFLIPQCLMQTILDKYKFGMNPNIINTMRRYYVDRSREIESKLVETYKDALGYRYDRKMSPTVQMVNGSQRPLGYYYYLYTGEELGRHMANGRVSCTIKSVEDMKTWLESKLVNLESNQKYLERILTQYRHLTKNVDELEVFKTVLSAEYNRFKFLREKELDSVIGFYEITVNLLHEFIETNLEDEIPEYITKTYLSMKQSIDKESVDEEKYKKVIANLKFRLEEGSRYIQNLLDNPVKLNDGADKDDNLSTSTDAVQSFLQGEVENVNIQSTSEEDTTIILSLSTLSERGMFQLIISTLASLESYKRFVESRIEHSELVLEYFNCNSMLKQLKELDPYMYEGKPNYTLDRVNDILLITPTVNNSGDTRRYTTANPDIQGKNKKIKQAICGRKPDREIASIDIKGQELTILICGAMSDKELQRYYSETGDGYRSFGKKIGISEDEYSEEIKAAIKIPVLASMNGGGPDAIKRDLAKLGYENLAKPLQDIFNKDEKYRKLVDIAEEEAINSKKQNRPVYRKGMFGSVIPATKAGKWGYDFGTRKRQALNSNFQLTASEIISYCLHAMIYDLIHKTNKWGFSLEEITPIIPIYDEMVFDIDGSLNKEDVKDFISFYLTPQIGNWNTMSGTITIGKNYIGK